jgi:hypothetical protein
MLFSSAASRADRQRFFWAAMMRARAPRRARSARSRLLGSDAAHVLTGHFYVATRPICLPITENDELRGARNSLREMVGFGVRTEAFYSGFLQTTIFFFKLLMTAVTPNWLNAFQDDQISINATSSYYHYQSWIPSNLQYDFHHHHAQDIHLSHSKS